MIITNPRFHKNTRVFKCVMDDLMSNPPEEQDNISWFETFPHFSYGVARKCGVNQVIVGIFEKLLMPIIISITFTPNLLGHHCDVFITLHVRIFMSIMINMVSAILVITRS